MKLQTPILEENIIEILESEMDRHINDRQFTVRANYRTGEIWSILYKSNSKAWEKNIPDAIENWKILDQYTFQYLLGGDQVIKVSVDEDKIIRAYKDNFKKVLEYLVDEGRIDNVDNYSEFTDMEKLNLNKKIKDRKKYEELTQRS